MYKGSLGKQILVEFYGCSPEILNDVSLIEQLMVKAAQKADATVINSTFHHFSPFGVSGVVVIQESHLAIHTWPEYGFASMDIFTCGDTVDPWISFDFLKEQFKAEYASPMEIRRGQMSLLDKQYDLANLETQRDELTQKAIETKYKRNIWFTDRNEDIALSLRHQGAPLYREQTPFQKVEVFETSAYGKMLSCDNMVMTTEKDEFVYHEMISHPALLTKQNVDKALVIGGGDGGTIRELLKHDIAEVVMVEIDEKVIEASKAHFPKISSAFGDERLNLTIDDGIKYVKEASDGSFDLVVIDSTDPVGPAKGLFSEDFYRDVDRILKEDGLLITQSESPHFNREVFIEVYQLFFKIFGRNNVHPYFFFVPTYPTGMWSFSYCSKSGIHPIIDFQESKADSFLSSNELNYYNTDIHKAAFAVPNFVKKMFDE